MAGLAPNPLFKILRKRSGGRCLLTGAAVPILIPLLGRVSEILLQEATSSFLIFC